MSRPVVALVLVLGLCSGRSLAQAGGDLQTAADEKGFASVVQFGGSMNSSGKVFKLDSAVGYNFNSHFGLDVGLPIYFVHPSNAATGSTASNNGIGNPYADFRLTFRSAAVNYRSVGTLFMPVANKQSGLNTGRLTADWTNRVEHSFSRLTPFIEAGLGNTVRDSRLFERPFTSLGFNAHVEGGASIDMTEHLQVGASGYAVVPSGEQRLYSRLLKASGGAMPQHGRPFETTTETLGTADLTRDHGFSTWIGASPNQYLDMELGYTRSIPYDLNTVSFTIGVNIGRLSRKSK